MLLALTIPPSADETITAGILVTVFRIPVSESESTSAALLDKMVASLMQRSDRPRNLRSERRSIAAGMTFDRVALRRDWNGQEIGMTIWATVRKGYLITITGTYSSNEGLVAIETLLMKMRDARSTEWLSQ